VALVQALFSALMVAVFVFIQPSLGFQESFLRDPPTFVAFVTAHYAFYYWVSLVGVAASALLIVLALALDERLRAGSPALVAGATAFGYLGAGLLLLKWSFQHASFTMIGSASAAFAASRVPGVWYDATNRSAFLALGLWMLLLSWAALRRGGLPRALAYVGVLAGALNVAAIFDVPFGLLLIAVWFVAVGVALWQRRPTVSRAEADG
jgi:hypothetical protein